MTDKPVRYEVVLTEDALRDLEEICDYIAEHDAPAKAAHVLAAIEKLLATLAIFPERSAVTKELLAIGIRDYRETYFKPYRVVYRVVNQQVYVYLIVDGRRDMQALLLRRLLRN
ncbi:MAG: type II toxin-antitoxin system RelE/ParE family toxin [Polaromonas sp.]|uniref:type II toxin-antitoxin system RelE/ParE family toxin n=1 Tax=Polaromonas sp. TaxID=1869339 RepID=UPI0027359A2A|nr:type II toxin-antitoxin system RelE/ParE family toxin [Polaromonas sp.]MDP2817032.1 type II toxin-antitoxin system RelE/ParE family toxin [Polaromonas sp.]